jgi:hypothetical protein
MYKISIFLRDLKIVTKAVWVNLLLFILLQICGAALLSLFGVYPKSTFLDLLVDAFHMSMGERVVATGDGVLPSILTFLLPLITIIVMGEGALRVFSVFMARGKHQEEWNTMVANTFSNHIVIFGVGELGKAMVKRLHTEHPNDKIVLVDLLPGLFAETGLSDENVVFIQSDMTNIETLRVVNSHKAKLVFLVSGNDVINLEAAYKILQLNPQAQIWVRLHHSGLVDLMDLSKKSNLHFFCPYQQAAELIVNHLLDDKVL